MNGTLQHLSQICLIKGNRINNGTNRKRCEACSKLTVKLPKRR